MAKSSTVNDYDVSIVEIASISCTKIKTTKRDQDSSLV